MVRNLTNMCYNVAYLGQHSDSKRNKFEEIELHFCRIESEENFKEKTDAKWC